MTVHSKKECSFRERNFLLTKGKSFVISHVFLFKIIKLTIIKPIHYVDDYFNEYGQSIFRVSSLKFYYTVDILEHIMRLFCLQIRKVLHV